MVIGQLKDAVRFEAGITNTDTFGGWFDITFQEEMAKITASLRFPELVSLDVSLSSGSFAAAGLMPISSVQHLDLDAVRYLPTGDITQVYRLQNWVNKNSQPQTGIPLYFKREGQNLQVYPIQNLSNTDTLLVNVWTYCAASLDTDIIIPDSAVLEVKFAMLARSCMFTDPKRAPMYREWAREARAACQSMTDLNQ